MKLVIVAGEASGDSLGAGLVEALRNETSLELSGVGGEQLQAQGLISLFPFQELSLIGFSAVLKQLPHLLKRVREVANHIISTNPDCAVMIDAQDFCDRVAKIVRQKAPHIKLVKYVCPTVWAWREGRAAKLKPLYDHALAIFPFEPAFMQKLNSVKTTYVGHNLVEKLKNFESTKKTHALLLPGSRRGEIAHHLPIFMELLQNKANQYEWQMPILAHLKPMIENIIAPFAIKPKLIEGESHKWQAYAGADFALAASGTVSLELALCNVPHIGIYKGNGIEAFIMRKMVKLPSILLPNIILNQIIVPELIQSEVSVENLLKAIDNLDKEKQKQAFAQLKNIMQTRESPNIQAAKVLLHLC